jgi:hypothetical protein
VLNRRNACIAALKYCGGQRYFGIGRKIENVIAKTLDRLLSVNILSIP